MDFVGGAGIDQKEQYSTNTLGNSTVFQFLIPAEPCKPSVGRGTDSQAVTYLRGEAQLGNPEVGV